MTPEFAKARASGRAMHLGYCMGKHGTLISFFNVYGHSGAAKNQKLAKATSVILEAIMMECKHFPKIPKFLIGDINGNFENFPPLETLCDPLGMGWSDLNRCADTWGQPTLQPTCRTSSSNQPTIRDYVFACPLAMPLITNFRVVDHDLCPTHSTLKVQIVPRQQCTWQYTSKTKLPLKILLDNAFTSRFGEGPAEPPHDLQQDLEQLLQDESLPQELQDPEVMTVPHPYLQNIARAKLAEERARYRELRDGFNASSEAFMNHAFAVVQCNLKRHLEEQDMDSFWRTFWETVEGAVCTFTDVHDTREAAAHRGRGLAPVSLTRHQLPKAGASKDDYEVCSPAWLSAITHQAN